MAKRTRTAKSVETLTHGDATRKNIPTAEHRAVMREEDQNPIRVAYERRNRDLDPQLVWRGKDEQDGADLIVQAPPLFIQEKVHPKVLIDDLMRQSAERAATASGEQIDLFADFNGLPDPSAATEFYQHDANWSNRMILGDSLQVMASLAEREGMRGQVQCIYIDPPYGIKFNSNFQWSTTSRDVRDGKREHITREPEQVKAFRDTWRDGIHSYLTYLRDRLTVARDLLTDSGSVFVQIGDENVHRVRALMDEVFGDENFVTVITFRKTGSTPTDKYLPGVVDFILWYGKDIAQLKYRQLNQEKKIGGVGGSGYKKVENEVGDIRNMTKDEKNDPDSIPESWKILVPDRLTSSHEYSRGKDAFTFQGNSYSPGKFYWSTSPEGLTRLAKSSRLTASPKTLSYKRYLNDFPMIAIPNLWGDTVGAHNITYVVQTALTVIQRCILMTTDPGDLVLDPTCGSGTTAYVAEQWGRRWITIDTSRVAPRVGACARHGGALSVLSPRGQRGGATQGSGTQPHRAIGNARVWRHPTGLCV